MRFVLPSLVIFSFLVSFSVAQLWVEAGANPTTETAFNPLPASPVTSGTQATYGRQGLLTRLASTTPRPAGGEGEERQLYGRPGMLQFAPSYEPESELDLSTIHSRRGYGPTVVFVEGYVASPHYNATQPVSPILMNPDQFWNRKQQPVVEVRNHAMFGIDPALACDEWEGYCGCCGLKAGPGHLGIKCLRGTDPCECVECCALRQKKGNCCPNCSTGKCR